MVEWKKLGEIAVVQKKKNKQHVTENAYSITQAGLVPTKSFFKEKTHVTSSDTSGYYIVEKDWFVYSPSRIDVGSINYLKDEGPVIVSPIDVAFSIDKSICLPSYLLCFFFTYQGKAALLKNREGVEGMGRRNLPFDSIKSMLIPIPSLSEQARIVGILDTFTASIDNLKAQIAQRRKQYEHYRDQLLDLKGKEGVEMKTLGEVVISLKTGLNPRKNFVLNTPDSDLPYITGKDIFNNTINISDKTDKINKAALVLINKRACLEKDLILFASTGTGTVGRMAIIEEYNNDWGISETLYSLKLKDGYISKFIMYLLYSNSVKRQYEPKISKGSVPHLKVVDLLNVILYIPSLSEQSRIVSILDTFEASIQNLEAQLKQREKQYEYYRNKLLTF